MHLNFGPRSHVYNPFRARNEEGLSINKLLCSLYADYLVLRGIKDGRSGGLRYVERYKNYLYKKGPWKETTVSFKKRVDELASL